MGLFSFSDVLKDVSGMLNESRKLSLKNKKLMFSVLVFPLLLNGLVYLYNVFPTKPERSTPPQLDVSSCISMIVWTIPFITDLVSVLLIVHASAHAHKRENINIKHIPVLTLKSLKRPLITSLYIDLVLVGFSFLFVIIFSPLFLYSPSFKSLFAKPGPFRFLLLPIPSYLGIVWDLSMVISILEETHGIHALGKARKIAKGMRPKTLPLEHILPLTVLGFI
ncbi:unnamed protein product [Microthlaspi erraticum]|uniref:Uncharacterized protein n=1 Tax=Microthlaspi erraticum TaxID=1685480 RepID=A0A6D2I7S8_9BRAS|nr:unnamed protein product [Microthlaspi erraticum]